ncbi:hypothetical protein ABKN59_010149 [Abortiporus biennis]
MAEIADNVPKRPRFDPTKLLSHEEFWRDHQVWLQQQGYMLRPRYKPDWIPTWESSYPYYLTHQDGIATLGIAADPRNHCVPIYDVLKVPNTKFVSIGEAVEFFRQIIEGIQFMHHHHIAHRDIMGRIS